MVGKYLVRMVSNGDNNTPASPADMTAMARLAKGCELSATLAPPTPKRVNSPGSEMLNIAASKLLVQLSMVLRRTECRNDAFDPFHTPHAPSFCHSCEMTSRRESGRRSSSL